MAAVRRVYLTLLLIILVYADSAKALQCYQCISTTDPKCKDEPTSKKCEPPPASSSSAEPTASTGPSPSPTSSSSASPSPTSSSGTSSPPTSSSSASPSPTSSSSTSSPPTSSSSTSSPPTSSSSTSSPPTSSSSTSSPPTSSSSTSSPPTDSSTTSSLPTGGSSTSSPPTSSSSTSAPDPAPLSDADAPFADKIPLDENNGRQGRSILLNRFQGTRESEVTYHCFAHVYKDSDTEVVERGCTTDAKYCETKTNKISCETCDTDQCNSAGMLMPSLLVFAAAAIVLR